MRINETNKTSEDTHWTVLIMRSTDAPVRVVRVSPAWLVVLAALILLAGLAAVGAWHAYAHLRSEAARAEELEVLVEKRADRLRELELQLAEIEGALDAFSELEDQLRTYLDEEGRDTDTAEHAHALARDQVLAALRAGPEANAVAVAPPGDAGGDLELRLMAAAAGADEQRSRLDELRTAVSAAYGRSEDEPHLWPVAGGQVTSDFGWRINPITRIPEYHHGVDVAAPTGTPIVATADGRVVFAGRLSLYGETIRIRHSETLETLYAHCHEITVSVGDRVSAGQIIGYVGTTGRSTGPHVHYEVRIDGEPIDPRPYLPD